MQAYQNFCNTLLEILQFAASTFTRDGSKRTHHDAVLKGEEEFGELCEAVQIYTGRMSHKTLNEPVYGEIADNINQHCDLLAVFQADMVKALLSGDASSEELIPSWSIDDIKRDALRFEALLCPVDDVFTLDDDEHYKVKLGHPYGLHYALSEHLYRIKHERMMMLYCQHSAQEVIYRLLLITALLYCDEQRIAFSSLDDRIMGEAIAHLHERYLLPKFAKWQRVDAAMEACD